MTLAGGSPDNTACAQIAGTMRPILAVLTLAAAIPAAASSQTIAPFALVRSPIARTGDARPSQFVSAASRRAIAMGTEGGACLSIWLFRKSAVLSRRDRPRDKRWGKLPCQVDNYDVDCGVAVGFGKQWSSGTRPRLSWGRSAL